AGRSSSPPTRTYPREASLRSADAVYSGSPPWVAIRAAARTSPATAGKGRRAGFVGIEKPAFLEEHPNRLPQRRQSYVELELSLLEPTQVELTFNVIVVGKALDSVVRDHAWQVVDVVQFDEAAFRSRPGPVPTHHDPSSSDRETRSHHGERNPLIVVRHRGPINGS